MMFSHDIPAKKYHQRLQLIFKGKDSAPYSTVRRWFVQFTNWKTKFKDRPRNPLPPSAVTPQNILAVREIAKQNPCCTFQYLEQQLGAVSPA